MTNPPSIAIRRSSPQPDATLPRSGPATEMPERGDARRTAPRVRRRKGKRRVGIGGRRTAPRGVTPGASPGEEMGEEPSADDGYRAGRRADAICVAMASVRPVVVAVGPERIEPAVSLPSVQQLCRSHDEAAGAVRSLQPQGEGNAKRMAAPPLIPVGKGMPGTPCCFRFPPPSVSLWGWGAALGWAAG